MIIHLDLFKSDLGLEGKKALDNFKIDDLLKIVYENEDNYMRLFLDTTFLHENIIRDLYENLNELDLSSDAKQLLEQLKTEYDSPILYYCAFVGVRNERLLEIGEKIHKYYEKNYDERFYYSLVDDTGFECTLHRFKHGNQSYKVDTYETIENDIDVIELVNYDSGETTLIDVKFKDEIIVLDTKFKVKKYIFGEKKIQKAKGMILISKICNYFKGPSSALIFSSKGI